MKILIPAVASIGIASAHLQKDCADISNLDGMKTCLQAMIKENKKSGKEMKQFKKEVNEKLEPIQVTVEGDYHEQCVERKTVNGAPEFLNTPVKAPEPINWSISDYYYFMNCVDEVEMRAEEEMQFHNATIFGPAMRFPFPKEPFFRLDPRPGRGLTIDQIANKGWEEFILSKEHGWAWEPIGLFYAYQSAHGREMMSWAPDEIKEFWNVKFDWWKPEFMHVNAFKNNFIQAYTHRFCTALPTFKRMYGSPYREDGCNPKYPYTSWFNEGLNSTAAECDANFSHEAPKSFSVDKIAPHLPNGEVPNCFDCGQSAENLFGSASA